MKVFKLVSVINGRFYSYLAESHDILYVGPEDVIKPVEYKPGEWVYPAEGQNPLFAFKEEVAETGLIAGFSGEHFQTWIAEAEPAENQDDSWVAGSTWQNYQKRVGVLCKSIKLVEKQCCLGGKFL